jgi:hypothetical protein
MARLNLLNLNFRPRTHDGAPARNISTELQLRRSVLACLLWESQFYEDANGGRTGSSALYLLRARSDYLFWSQVKKPSSRNVRD